MWGRSSSQSQDTPGIQIYRREEESVEDELRRLPKVNINLWRCRTVKLTSNINMDLLQQDYMAIV